MDAFADWRIRCNRHQVARNEGTMSCFCTPFLRYFPPDHLPPRHFGAPRVCSYFLHLLIVYMVVRASIIRNGMRGGWIPPNQSFLLQVNTMQLLQQYQQDGRRSLTSICWCTRPCALQICRISVTIAPARLLPSRTRIVFRLQGCIRVLNLRNRTVLHYVLPLRFCVPVFFFLSFYPISAKLKRKNRMTFVKKTT